MDCVIEFNKRRERDSECDFAKLEHTVAGTVWIKPNGMGGLTVMTPEDY